MPLFPRRFCAALFVVFACTASAQAQNAPVSTADAVQEAFVRVTKKLAPAVVTIYSERYPATPKIDPKTGQPIIPKAVPDDDEEDDGLPMPFGDPGEPKTSLGTGVVFQSDGYVLTNYHVVKGADVVRVLFNAQEERPDRPLAQVVGFDEESDLAILKVARTGLATATFADSDKVRIGEWAIAIGAPFDQPLTVTVGVISAKGRHLEKKGRVQLQDYIQTDASINPGNSGGPLINLAGEVIGINTAILSPSRFNVGIGFSVPSNTVRRLLPILVKGGKVKRGFLGIQYVRIDDEVAKEFGVKSGMQIGALAKLDGKFIGPAKDAGLQEDDIITAVNDEPIETSDQFRAFVAGNPPGTEMKFSIARPIDNGEPQKFEVKVTLGDWNAQFGAKTTPVAFSTKVLPPLKNLGIEVESADKLTATDRKRFDLTMNVKGAVVTRVLPGSPADEADIKAGFRIVRARINDNWNNVLDAPAWQKLEKTAAPGDRILMQLRDRDDVSVYKVVAVPEPAPAVVPEKPAAETG